MLESKLWHNKIDTKNVKVAKKVEFIKTCDQYPRKFNFDHFFSSIILPLLYRGKNRSPENAVRVEWVISFCLGESWGNKQKWKGSVFWLTNVCSSNLNTINLNIFQSPDQLLGVPWPKGFECLGEWHKNNFPGKNIWRSTISENVCVCVCEKGTGGA